MRVYLPKIFEEFAEKYPEVMDDLQKLTQTCRNIGPLDDKNQDLIKLGIAIGKNSRGGVLSATRKALAAGATNEEILHAVLLSLTIVGFPNMIAAMSWINEALDKST